MKRKYVRPKASMEEFLANEYVAVCAGAWQVACQHELANDYEKANGYYDNGNVSHSADHCGRGTNQVVYAEDNRAKKMTEIGTDGLGTLNCTIYTDATYTQVRPIGDVNNGDYIYWTTSAGSRVWHHQGRVSGTYHGSPNHS